MGAGTAHKPSGNALITAVIVYVRLWHEGGSSLPEKIRRKADAADGTGS
jgi:hypothetical protein